jgi:hypothetical protein
MDTLWLVLMLSFSIALSLKTLAVTKGVLVTVGGFVVTILSTIWGLIGFLPKSVVWVGNLPMWLLLVGSFTVFSMLQYFAPGVVMSLAVVRETFGKWLTAFERAILGTEYGDDKDKDKDKDGGEDEDEDGVVQRGIKNASDMFMTLYNTSLAYIHQGAKQAVSALAS